MSSRSFTVFQDEPCEVMKPALTQRIEKASLAIVVDVTAHTLVSIEKENVHPVTGELAGSSSSGAGKKRKTGVLATKIQVLPATKKQKETADYPKKRKPLTSTSNSKDRRAAKKDDPLRGPRSSKRKLSPLPKVEEIVESEKDGIRPNPSQAHIDSRCYELTVLPLADVSQAYETSLRSEATDRAQKEKSVEPELRDYFSPSLSRASLPPSSPAPAIIEASSGSISTPERKQIYAVFTFTSPSSSSERLRTTRNLDDHDKVKSVTALSSPCRSRQALSAEV